MTQFQTVDGIKVQIRPEVKRVWVEHQNLAQGAGSEAQVQVKEGRRILAIYRTDNSEEGFGRAIAYADAFAKANGLTVSDGKNY